jgi:putative transposase
MDMVERENEDLSIRRQCELLALNRSSLYYERVWLSAEERRMLWEMDKIYLDFPSYGSRRMSREPRGRGYRVGRFRVRSLMRLLGVEAIYPRKRLCIPAKDHQIYPYLLREVYIYRANVVWAADITYIRLKRGFVYLVAVMDVFSRYIISWQLSNTLESGFC